MATFLVLHVHGSGKVADIFACVEMTREVVTRLRFLRARFMAHMSGNDRPLSFTYSGGVTFTTGNSAMMDGLDLDVYEEDGWIVNDEAIGDRCLVATALVVSDQSFFWKVEVNQETRETSEVYWCDLDRLLH